MIIHSEIETWIKVLIVYYLAKHWSNFKLWLTTCLKKDLTDLDRPNSEKTHFYGFEQKGGKKREPVGTLNLTSFNS